VPSVVLLFLQRVFCPEQYRRRKAAESLVDKFISIGAVKPHRKEYFVSALLSTTLSSQAIERGGDQLFDKVKKHSEKRRKRNH